MYPANFLNNLPYRLKRECDRYLIDMYVIGIRRFT